MRKSSKILLIVAIALVLLGGAIFTVGVIGMNKQNATFINGKYQEKTYEASEEIKAITIDGGTDYVKILPYDKDGYLVKCFEQTKVYNSVSVKDSVLCIERQDSRKWYDFISLFSMPTYVTVYVPEGVYRSLTVNLDVGDVFVEQNFTFDKADISCSTGNIQFLASTQSALNLSVSTGKVTVGDNSKTFKQGDISIKVSTGKTEIKGTTCTSFTSTGDTGDIFMSNLVSTGDMNITRSTGDVKFYKCDAANITVRTDTGSVTGTLLSSKVFIYKTDTGDVNLPETESGGTCKITTDTGNINISISQ